MVFCDFNTFCNTLRIATLNTLKNNTFNTLKNNTLKTKILNFATLVTYKSRDALFIKK